MARSKLLLVFFGMIATGKSSLAQACADSWGCTYHNSDVVRKQLAGLDADSRQHRGYDSGIYSNSFSRRTYDALVSLIRQDFEHGDVSCVLVDASYQAASERQRLWREFGGMGRMAFVHCQCPEGVLRKRMEQRLLDPTAVSDGRWEIYLQQKQRFEPPVEIPEGHLLTLNTDQPLDALVSLVAKHVGLGMGANDQETAK